EFRLDLLQLAHSPGTVGLGQGEGDVGAARRVGDVLQHHVDVDLRVGHGAEDAGRRAGVVGNTGDGDLRLRPVMGDAGDQRLFHGDLLDRAGHGGTRLVTVGRADSDRYPVPTRVLHRPQVEDLGPT